MQIVLLKKEHVLTSAKILHEAYYSSAIAAKKHLNSKIKTKESIVAIEDGEVVGVLIYARDYSHFANYAEDLAVAKKYRGKGIAKALLLKYVDISRKETPKKQKYALSSTEVANRASVKLHEKAGFKKIGVLRGLHYGKDEAVYAYDLR